jgi:hypothetical protein
VKANANHLVSSSGASLATTPPVVIAAIVIPPVSVCLARRAAARPAHLVERPPRMAGNPNEVPLKPPFDLFFQTSDWCKTTFDPEIVSFSVRHGRNRNFFLSTASLNQHFSERLTVPRFVAEPCNRMLRSELQLFLNANPGIRMIGFGVQLSTFFLFHPFKVVFPGG